MFSGIASYFVRTLFSMTAKSEASDCGEHSEPQSENLADIDWNCLLSTMLYLLMPISSRGKGIF